MIYNIVVVVSSALFIGGLSWLISLGLSTLLEISRNLKRIADALEDAVDLLPEISEPTRTNFRPTSATREPVTNPTTSDDPALNASNDSIS